MPTSPDLSLVVPAYKEAAKLAATLDAIVSHLQRRPGAFEIIVAVDGVDASSQEAERRARADPRIVVVGSPVRRGKGRAVREGIALARGRLIGYLDADGKVPVEELDKLLEPFEEEWDVAVGSRALRESRVAGRRPWHRRVGSAVFGVLVRRCFGLRNVHDTQCGMKIFRAEVARELFARQVVDGYLFDLEVLLLAAANGYRVREVAVRWHDDGDSRFDVLTGGPRILVDLVRIARHRVVAVSAVGGEATRPTVASTRSATRR